MKCGNLKQLFYKVLRFRPNSSLHGLGFAKLYCHQGTCYRHRLSLFSLRYYSGQRHANTQFGVEKVQLQEFCEAQCPCVCNTSLWLVTNMQQMQSKDANADLVCVLDEQNCEKIKIVMKIYGSERTVMRPRDETLDKSLERIRINVKNANAKLSKKVRKRAKKEGQGERVDETAENTPQVSLLDKQGNKINEQSLNVIDGWKMASTLKICDVEYRVVTNPPKIGNIQIVQRPIVGFTIFPQLELKFAESTYSRFEWFKSSQKSSEQHTEEDGPMETDEAFPRKHKIEFSDAESNVCEENSFRNWEPIGDSQTYTPSIADLGHEIRLRVTPGSESFPVNQDTSFSNFLQTCDVTTGNAVMDMKEKYLFTDRIAQTKEKCSGNRLRVVSYNILANVYASTEYAQDFLFPYCPTDYMDISYRQQLVVKEICGYNSDIICLQEVDRSVFESYYMPVMSSHGFAGALASKDGIKEGVALFYRKDRFTLKMVDNVILRTSLKEERNRDLFNKISTNSDFLKNFLSKPTCLLVAVLESKENSKKLLIGNTHLYWHPRGCHIRLIQMELILREMRRLYKIYSEDSELSCLLMGDLNSHPHSAVVQLITKGNVPPNHSDWYTMGKAELLHDMSLTNSALFNSVCGTPSYTTLVTSFQGCLDYMFIDDTLEVKKVIPQPDHADVIKHCALPNVSTPSDHIAQVAEVGWKSPCE